MNNLFWIPGIVCQGDDGRPVSKPKQTDMENTQSASRGRMMGLSEAARHLLFSFSGWELCSGAATTAPFYSDLMNSRREKKKKKRLLLKLSGIRCNLLIYMRSPAETGVTPL